MNVALRARAALQARIRQTAWCGTCAEMEPCRPRPMCWPRFRCVARLVGDAVPVSRIAAAPGNQTRRCCRRKHFGRGVTLLWRGGGFRRAAASRRCR